MLWFTIWFMVILKIPVLYLAYVIWWAVKEPPESWANPAAAEGAGGEDGPRWSPRRDRGRRGRPRGGPHGAPARRPAAVPASRSRSRRAA